MNRVSALFDLQQVDSEIDARQISISQIDLALTNTTALDAAREEARKAENAFAAAKSKLRDLEIAAEDSERHAAELEKKLNAGKISGAKQISAAESEIANFRQRRTEIDDESLEAMTGLEQAEAANKAAKARLIEVQADWEKSIAALRKERARLEAELPGLRAQREQRVKIVMPPDVLVYEKLRGQKQGIAVAEVKNGKICGRCRVELPLNKQREVKSGMNIINCPSCGRILYLR